MQRTIVVLLALCVMAGGTSSIHAAIISNASFEEGDFVAAGGSLNPIPSWGGIETFATDDSDFPHGGFGPHSGLAYAAFGAIGGLDPISQIISTTSGQDYSLSFWLASDGLLNNRFQVMWDSTVLFDQTDIPIQAYQEYTFSVTGLVSNTLTFAGQDDNGYLSLDDVQLTEVAAVPEPASLSIFAFGAVGAICFGWMRKQTARAIAQA